MSNSVKSSIASATLLGSVAAMSDEALRDCEEYKANRAKEWAERTLESLLAYSDHDINFAQSLCKKVSDKFGKNDQLSALLLKRLNADRKGGTRGPHKKYSDAHSTQLLDEYDALNMPRTGMKRPEVLDFLAKHKGLTGSNRGKKIEGKITAARKKVE